MQSIAARHVISFCLCLLYPSQILVIITLHFGALCLTLLSVTEGEEHLDRHRTQFIPVKFI